MIPTTETTPLIEFRNIYKIYQMGCLLYTSDAADD